MARTDKEILDKIIKEYSDNIEAQISWVRYSFNIPRGEALAILENYSYA